MTIYLIRHGQSEFNAVYTGSGDAMIIDAPLTELGQQQAKHARSQVAKLGISHVICSPLTRAIQTALLVCPDHTPQVVAKAREHLGHSCDVGVAPSKLQSRFPELDFSHLDENWWHQGPLNEYGIPAEPQEVFKARMAELARDLHAHTARPLAVVCHGYVVDALTGVHPENCGIVPLHP